MKKIPTIVGLVMVLILVIGMAVVTALVKNATNLPSRASSQDVLVLPAGVANISDTAVSVYWIAAAAQEGTVTYDGKIATDNLTAASHLVRITNLKPATKYSFKVAAATVIEATTEATPPPVVAEPVFGKVTNSDDSPAAGAIVILDKAVARTKDDGSFVLPVSPPVGQEETIMVYSVSGSQSKVTCQGGADHPVPTVKIGENLNCSKKSAAGFSVTSPSSGLEVLLKDNETVSSPLPTIAGRAGPNQMVRLEINSPMVYTGTVKADPAGNWSWTPPASLTPGKHTATITVVNADGTTQTVTRTFYVSADTSILPVTAGTPSATATHFTCVNDACVKVNGPGPDSCVSDADCAPPPTPLPAPLPPVESGPPPTPQSGALETTLVVLGAGAALLIVGLGLIL